MTWKKFIEEAPPDDSYVVIRTKNEDCYTYAVCHMTKRNGLRGLGTTEYGHRLYISDDDSWQEIEK